MLSRNILKSPTVLSLAALLVMGCGDDGGLTSPPATGTIAVITTSIGSPLDADGYTLLFGGSNPTAIGVNDTTAIVVEPGAVEIELTHVSDDCAIRGENPISVTITQGGTIPVAFSVACPALFDYIAFPNSRDGLRYLSAMKPDGSGLIDLTAGSATIRYSYPAWAPEATRIAFVQRTCVGGGGPCEPGDLYVLDIADQSVTRLTDDGSPEVSTWSPDGTRIAYASFTGESQGPTWGDIIVIGVDGSDLVNLTPGPAVDGDPAWSPDGTEIAFVRKLADGNDIWVMNADGSNPHSITDVAPGVEVWEPAWSPDGSRFAFVHAEFGSEGIWTMNADGSNQTLIAAGFNWRPTWSPDGTQIAYEYNAGIAIMNADGTNVVEYPGGIQPAWSRGQSPSLSSCASGGPCDGP